jgi:hypothetical protein
MTVNRTTLLNLPLPVTGTESGSWGDTTNYGLTEYMDIAVAGALSITASTTLTNSTGNSSATNIGSSTAQYRTLVVPASGPSANVVITAPSSNRTYHVVNKNATYTVQVRAGSNSGITFQPGQTGTVTYDSVAADYVLVGTIGATVTTSYGGTGLTSYTAGDMVYYASGTLLSKLSIGTTNQVLTSNGSIPVWASNLNVTVNKITFTAPATGATLTIADGKTLTASNTLTLAGTDSTTMTFPPASASVGYINAPQNSQSSSYTTVAADSGKLISHPSSDNNARTFTIDNGVAYANGTVISFSNMSATSLTIALSSGTLYYGALTGSRSLGQYGMATAVKVDTNVWLINGSEMQ